MAIRKLTRQLLLFGLSVHEHPILAFTRPFAAMIAGQYRLPSGVSIRLVRFTSIAAKCGKAVSIAEDAT
jgi:hypothetical protein